MSTAARLCCAAAMAVILSLVVADAQVAGIAVWKIVLAACGLALIKYAR